MENNWYEELMDMVNNQEENTKAIDELNEMLKNPPKKEKKETDWDKIQAAIKFNKENNTTFQENPRQFNKQSYEDNDKVAKDLMITFLTGKGHQIVQEEETYSTDIITNKGKYEVEMSGKDFTIRESFPYPMVNFLGRKEKYGNDYHYVIISKNKQYALVAASKDIFKEENKATIYCNTNRNGYDEVFQLPKDKVKFFKL